MRSGPALVILIRSPPDSMLSPETSLHSRPDAPRVDPTDRGGVSPRWGSGATGRSAAESLGIFAGRIGAPHLTPRHRHTYIRPGPRA
jgi:hypothetical protein